MNGNKNTSTSGSMIFQYPGDLCYNTTGNSTLCPATYSSSNIKAGAKYTTNNPDNVLRQGDSNIAMDFTKSHPHYNAGMVGSQAPGRPYFLGRSFNSVAEMGYASRDEPWKSLNFFSKDSGDAGLLDFFSLSESSAYAGGINVNTASAPVLAALLKGAYADANDVAASGSSSALTDSMANTIATAIRNYLGNSRQDLFANWQKAVFDPSDLAALNEQIAANSIGVNTQIGSDTNVQFGLKRTQEVLARALADSWNTRTWNLMIDIIAQTGRFPKTNVSTMDDFIVTGERRIWAHVAIDRFTGKVLALKIEPVNE